MVVRNRCYYSVSAVNLCLLVIFHDSGSVNDARHTSQAALSRTVLSSDSWSMIIAVDAIFVQR